MTCATKTAAAAKGRYQRRNAVNEAIGRLRPKIDPIANRCPPRYQKRGTAWFVQSTIRFWKYVVPVKVPVSLFPIRRS